MPRAGATPRLDHIPDEARGASPSGGGVSGEVQGAGFGVVDQTRADLRESWRAESTSSPHPHCQIWANAELPNQPAREQVSLREYRERNSACLLCRYLQLELEQKERIVCENDGFVALVPFWAVWPFEILVLSRRHLASMEELIEHERSQLGEILRRLIIRYDNLFEVAFPYSMGFHLRPTDGEAHRERHLHAHYYPPLLRSATVQKFLVGYEMLGTPQRDITPESAAARLQGVGELRYRDRDREAQEGIPFVKLCR